MRVGFLGLGNMGEPMAANLLAAGHQVTVWNRTAAKAQPLVNKGAKLAKDPKEAANNDVVCTMVSDDAALHALLNDGVYDGLPKGGSTYRTAPSA